MSRHAGIDLGTTNSCIAVFESGSPRVLPNCEGGRTTPSVVAMGENELAGEPAARLRTLQPKETVFSVKRLMGRRWPDIDPSLLPFELSHSDEGNVLIGPPGAAVSPEEISARILAKVRDDAAAYLGEEIDRAVIAVPAHFGDAQRQATAAAARIAGLEVLRLVNEPTAAALAWGRGVEDEKLLVFDLGGGTFDISILEAGGGVFEVLSTAGDTRLGGDDFDQLLAGRLRERWQLIHGEELPHTPEIDSRLLAAARAAKHELSTLSETLVVLPFLFGSKSLEAGISRAELETAAAGLLERLRQPLRQILEETKIQPDRLLMVGGMTRMPAIRALASEICCLEPLPGVEPDEAVALGAAIQAASIEGEDDSLLLDVTPLSLGIEIDGRLTRVLLPAKTTVPARTAAVFTTSEDNQSSVEINVLQGERAIAEENTRIGQVRLLGIPPSIAGVPQIEVVFDLDADGVLSVEARDLATGETASLTIEDTASLPEEEINRIISEAEGRRDEDLEKRRRRLEKSRATRMLSLLEKIIPGCPAELRPSLAEAAGALLQATPETLGDALDLAEASLFAVIDRGGAPLTSGAGPEIADPAGPPSA